jgi:hypothetical protein
VRWLRISLMVFGVLALVSGLALLGFEPAPEKALGWVLLPLGGAALVLVATLGEESRERASRTLSFRSLVLWVAVLALCAIALVVAWSFFA